MVPALTGLGQHCGNSRISLGNRTSWEGLKGSAACGVHGVGHLVAAVGEQVAVGVQRHGRRGMSEHLLVDLDVGLLCLLASVGYPWACASASSWAWVK